MQVFNFLAFSSVELGVSSSTINLILTVTTFIVIGLPLLLVARSKNKSKKVSLN